MAQEAHSTLRTYGVPVLTVGLAVLLTLLLQSLLKPSLFAFFYAAVAISAWMGGMLGGLLATGLSVAGINYFFVAPLYSFGISGLGSIVQMGVFVLVTLLISSLSSKLRRTQRHLQRTLSQTQESEERFRLALSNHSVTLFHQDQRLRYLWVHNPQGLQLPEEVVGKTDSDLFDPAEAEQLAAIKQQVLQTATSSRQEIALTINGQKRWYDLLVEPMQQAGSVGRGVTCAAFDITERKQTEERVQQLFQQAQEKADVLNSILSASTDNIYVFDRLGRYSYVSTGGALVLGFQPEQILGKTWHDLGLPAELMSQVDAQREQVMQTGQPLKGETYFAAPDGDHYYEYILTPLHNSTHGVDAVVAVSRDITDRKRMEAALQESQLLFQSFMQHSPATAFVKDADGRYVYVNALVEQMFNRPFGDWVGKTDFDLFPTEAAQQWRENDLRVLAEGETLQATEIAPQEDGDHHYLAFKFPLQDGAGRQLVGGMAIDITERVQAEAALRESEARFRQMADTAPVLIWMSGPDRLCHYFNKTWLDFTGRTLEQEMVTGWTEGVHPDDLQLCLDSYSTAFDARKKFTMEYRLRRFDGEYRWILDTGVPRFTPNGEFLGYIGSCIDIIDRIRFEKALQESEHRYAQILDSVQEMVFCKAPGSVVVYANKSACDYYGMTMEELRGITDVPFNELDFTQQYIQDDLKVFETGTTVEVLEEPNRRADGELRYFHTVKSPIFDTQGNVVELVGVSRDITERIRADAALRESEARFRAVFESNMIGILFWDADGTFTDANDAFLQMVGYDRTDLDNGDVRWDEMTPPEHRHLDQEALVAIANKGVCTPYEKEFCCKDGSRLPVLVGGASLEGFANKGVCFVLDIAERRQKELERAQLLEREQQARAEAELQQNYLHSLLMQAPASICIHRGTDHIFEFANPSYIQLIGGREVLNSPVREVFPDLAGQGFFELLDQVLETGEPFVGKEIAAEYDRHGNGTLEEGFFNFVYQPMQGVDGSNVGIMTFAFEVTDQVVARRKAEVLAEDLQRQQQALQESEERYRSLVSVLTSIVWAIDREGNFVTPQPDWEKYTGQPWEEHRGLGWTQAIHPEDQARVKALWEHARDTLTVYRSDGRIWHAPSQQYRYFEAKGVPLFNSDGTVQEWVGTVTDVHDRKQAEEGIRQLNEELESRVKKRTAQLQATNKELEAFSYSVSHDLRAPIRHINGFVDLLQKRLEKAQALDETSLRYLRTISDTTKEAGRLVDDLLSFSRMGRTEMRLTRLDLNQLLQEVMRDIQPEVDGRNIDWRLDPLPTVQADPTMLRLVLRNLLENAVKYSSPKSQASIYVGSTHTDQETVVFVRDNGVGFDMQYVHKLFGVFQRLHTNEEFEGTGIGLANVQRIIHRHGGKVWAEGELDQGATFYFSLPNTPHQETIWN
ncbi:MAG TPA: PAS domain S-box protein [Leptolyngbyaceae cyanobacterium]